jgi:hypothetical protein
MSLYGYARVSTLDQDLAIQLATLKAAGCEEIRAEKASDTRRDGRTELQVLLDFLRAGDTLVVTRIDRLARSLKDLQDIVHEFKAKGVALKATEQPVDASTAAGIKRFSICSGCSPNSKQICGASGSSKASAPPRHAASTKAASRRSMPPKSFDCARKKARSGGDCTPPRHRPGERLSPPWQAQRQRRGKREWECRSGLRCKVSTRVIGRRSARKSASRAPLAFVRAAAARMGSTSAVCLTGDGLMPREARGATAAVDRRAGPISSKWLSSGTPGSC